MISIEMGELLARGGMLGSCTADGGPDEIVWSSYNPALDPAGAERLATALAAEIGGVELDVVLVWEDAEELVLAHILAREFGVAVVRAYDFDGLVRYVGSFPEHPRVVLLADSFQDASTLRALNSLVAQQDGVVVATAALVPTPLLAGDPTARTLAESAPVGEAAADGIAP